MNDFIEAYNEACTSQEIACQEWIAMLRKDGVRAAHPDDGWVDWERSTVHLCYPQFDDGIWCGEIVALGTSSDHRLVRITGEVPDRFLRIKRWYFQEIE